MTKQTKIIDCVVCGEKTTRPKFCSHNCKIRDYQSKFKKNGGKCLICSNKVSKISLYCSEKCQEISRQNKVVLNDCLQCGKKTSNEMFCSNLCRQIASRAETRFSTCKFCGKEFEVDSVTRYYCSYECKERKFVVNENYFDGELTKEKLETLGQMISIGQIDTPTFMSFKSDEQTLIDLSKKLECTHPITKQKEIYHLRITSRKLINRLVELGLSDNRLLQEFPPFDILSGLFKTHRYKSIGGGWNVYRSLSSKLIRELEYRFGGKIVTKTFYTDITQEELGIEYFLIWNDDPTKHSEF